jgi:hypothetical protein
VAYVVHRAVNPVPRKPKTTSAYGAVDHNGVPIHNIHIKNLDANPVPTDPHGREYPDNLDLGGPRCGLD